MPAAIIALLISIGMEISLIESEDPGGIEDDIDKTITFLEKFAQKFIEYFEGKYSRSEIENYKKKWAKCFSTNGKLLNLTSAKEMGLEWHFTNNISGNKISSKSKNSIDKNELDKLLLDNSPKNYEFWISGFVTTYANTYIEQAAYQNPKLKKIISNIQDLGWTLDSYVKKLWTISVTHMYYWVNNYLHVINRFSKEGFYTDDTAEQFLPNPYSGEYEFNFLQKYSFFQKDRKAKEFEQCWYAYYMDSGRTCNMYLPMDVLPNLDMWTYYIDKLVTQSFDKIKKIVKFINKNKNIS